MKKIKILFVADTHLGFDLPFKPKIKRRRRGIDFFNNFKKSLQPALDGEIDFVVHGGDILFRSRVPAKLVTMAFESLVNVADRGVPVYIVPGNHERSRIPYPLLVVHENIHIFNIPRTSIFKKYTLTVSISGFPYERKSVSRSIHKIVEETDWKKCSAEIRLLCMHHIVEGAQVGVRNFTFKYGEDVIKGRDIPRDFACILSGHIHRYQILNHDLQGFPLKSPVFYPGSIERTSFDERNEDKGFLIITCEPDAFGGRVTDYTFHSLSPRQMIIIDLKVESESIETLKQKIAATLKNLDPNSIVRLRLHGNLHDSCIKLIKAEYLRNLAPDSMNISVRYMPTNNQS